MEIQLDGEPMLGKNEVIIEIHPKALNILVSIETPEKLFAEEK